MKKRNIQNRILLEKGLDPKGGISFKKGDFLKIVSLKKDPLNLKGYFEEIKGFCVGFSRKKGSIKISNIVRQVRFYYHFQLNSKAVRDITKVKGRSLKFRALRKKRLNF